MDGHGDLMGVEVRNEDGDWTVIGTDRVWEFTFQGDNAQPGEIVFEFRAKDGYSTSAVEQISVLKYGPPVVQIMEPEGNTAVQDDLEVGLKITGGYGNIETVEIRLNEGEWVGQNGSRIFDITIDISDLPEGELILEVKATDGTEYSEVARVLLDHSVPFEEPVDPMRMNLLIILLVVVAVVVTAVILHRRRS